MSSKTLLLAELTKKLQPDIVLGSAIYDNEAQKDILVGIKKKSLNKHGLISGATGTGKTKTVQLLTEALSKNGVSSLILDMKGDFSGIAFPGEEQEKIQERLNKINHKWEKSAHFVEFLSLGKEEGTKVRSTIIEFGPVLLSKLLELNDVQSGVVSMIFRYCDENGLLLLDIEDFKKTLLFLTNEGREEVKKEWGAISPSTTSTIIRKLIELESQGIEELFGEPSFDVQDLVRINERGEGVISIVRVKDLYNEPKLFTTFLLQLLLEVYLSFEEVGDLEAPKLMLFFDEAHLVFENANKTFSSELEKIIRLIRSKGVGIVFITQNPSDIPSSVLSQLGLKIQHSLRAFTAADRKNIVLSSQNFPSSDIYDIDHLLTNMGIGEALISSLDHKGLPTPPIHTLLLPPSGRMGTISAEELHSIVQNSSIIHKYEEKIDRESAYELLNNRIKEDVIAIESKKDTFEKLEESSLMKNPIAKEFIRAGKLVLGQMIRQGMRDVLGGILKTKIKAKG